MLTGMTHRYLRFTLEGKNVDQRVSELNSLPDVAKDYIGDMAYMEMSAVLRDSKTVAPRVPLKTGALQSTGFVDKPRINSQGVTVRLSYGGLAQAPYNKFVDYAIVTHEDTRRKYSRPDAGPKYVSTHYDRRRGAIVIALQEAIKTAIQETFS